jgi:hypothetical protein
MGNFDPKSLINLDQCVMNALDLFMAPDTEFPRLNLARFKRPLVVGSGNAIATGYIIADGQDAIFANESTYEAKLDKIKSIDGVILMSASAKKHAPDIVDHVKARGLDLMLFTCNPSPEKIDTKTIELCLFPSREEPYTYNTCTYMGMMMTSLIEDPQAEAKRILDHIRGAVDPALKKFGKKLGDYDAFYLLVPEDFDLIRVMLTTKFVELFGRRLSRDVFTWEQSKHATTVVEAPRELFIAIGCDEALGKEQLNIPLPPNPTYPAILAVGYYVIGKLQAEKPPWFKESIESYAKKASEIFHQKIEPIVKYT